nr:MAG TPA: apocytochrome F [Caudoviricetes sp.]
MDYCKFLFLIDFVLSYFGFLLSFTFCSSPKY